MFRSEALEDGNNDRNSEWILSSLRMQRTLDGNQTTRRHHSSQKLAKQMIDTTTEAP